MKTNSTQGSEVSNPIASSLPQRSKTELKRLDSDKNEDLFLSCTKILEEADEESVANLTPRLAEERVQEVSELEDIKNSILVRKSAEQDFNKDIFASKTTLETEESSQNQYDLESVSTFNEKDQKDALNLSIISSEGICAEERFCSPINAGRSSVPALNFSKIRKGVPSLNSSCISTTNASVVDSKYEMRLNESPSLNSTLSSISKAMYRGSGFKPTHCKNRLSHGKLTTNKLTKGQKKSNRDFKAATMKHTRKHSEDYEVTWKGKKEKISGDGFKKDHWNFSKKSKGKDALLG